MERDKNENTRKQHHHKQWLQLVLVLRMVCLSPRVTGKVVVWFVFSRLYFLKPASSALTGCNWLACKGAHAELLQA